MYIVSTKFQGRTSTRAMVRRTELLASPLAGPQAKANYVDDRGKAKYFNGRSELRAFVEYRRGAARSEHSGTTILIQGAPGAGKTALLHQLAEEARQDGWMIAGLEPQALYDPRLTAQILGKSYVIRTRRTIRGNVNVVSGESEKERVEDASALQVLKKRAPKGASCDR